MCGLIGYWAPNRELSDRLIDHMAEQIIHRGPDSAGSWHDRAAGLALGHRRLAIVDLSDSGHQPMVSASGRYVLSYNGEIYNFQDIRAELDAAGKAPAWSGHSDTEVLLAAVDAWGLDASLARLDGMFAFALWDTTDQSLVLARDRLGEKPLYYGRSGDALIFGSELGAFKPFPGYAPQIDRDALALYLRHNYIPAPYSIYTGIHKLEPGHYIKMTAPDQVDNATICYWNIVETARASAPLTNSAAELEDRLDDLLNRSIKRRMIADVPLGAFLSGGYDSTLTTAVMQSQSARPIKTFTIGFSDEGYNEAHHAKAVADHLGTEHTELYVSPKAAQDVIPKLPDIWSEPFSDSSQIPTFLVSQLARTEVTVSLSGDGGDELFQGYGRYEFAARQWKRLSSVPSMVRKGAAAGILATPEGLMHKAESMLPRRLRNRHLADRLPKLAQIMACPSAMSFYKSLVSHQIDPTSLVLGSQGEPRTAFADADRLAQEFGFAGAMGLIDTVTYLPGDILTKVDRASMAVSLESRIPLLDHRLVEFAMRVPQEFKHRDGQAKWLLRQVLYRYVPRALMDRPKMGFGVPIEHWLRGPLREWAEALLSERRLREEGYFDPAPIRKMWTEHVSGARRWHAQLWDILMFQAWLERHHPELARPSTAEAD
ncbi:asparagine synthase (glutamine-hydrolysing) [Roseovarius nanhaiticus]|uniref:asparagine synthase (glutamine-hydrolyzing) n=1 Tax=Roseovarius nanhaiticus TaxID=573024 RepID=A0A1N7EPB7_9RHOB|nr:asparagine synthase (glutamine-hydrolyzing) [Roseovarius nanhaiticus]SEK70135.1 asparagine synthase (glutamine-hydrolysing) [Roseovarius nanhaiticus]SIR89892.1 asparagine synthase (glutamine-hydrolysing) [Roseovarius nanhaiticus]